jgi:hypothetical protein
LQFVLRHICADVLLDPVSNVLRRSAGYYSRNRNSMATGSNPRQKRQDWTYGRRNESHPHYQANPAYGHHPAPNYFPNAPPQQGMYGAPTTHQPMHQYPMPNTAYSSRPNGSMMVPPFVGSNPPMMNSVWNESVINPITNRQNTFAANNARQNIYNSPSGSLPVSTYMVGAQACKSMTGERIAVNALLGPHAQGKQSHLLSFDIELDFCL